MSKRIKWGIIGPGNIAHKFVKGLKHLNDADVYAVASRKEERATAFASEYNISKVYGSYEQLAKDNEVDIVYIATPHPFHREHVKLCLEAGKAVVCEKPITINSKDTEELIEIARKNGVFLMEAMWTRFLPAIVKVREIIKMGIIGDIRVLKADFGFRCDGNPNGRLMNIELGGGALLDVGIYVVSLASMIFGKQPEEIKSTAHIGKTGVDEHFAAIFNYENGAIASISAAISTITKHDAYIYGTEAYLHIPDFWHADRVILYKAGQPKEVLELPFEATGYNYEAVEAMKCLKEGKLESGIIPLNESLHIMKTMDKIRAEWGLRYPFE